MATFRETLRAERKRLGLNQSEFGQELGIIMTDISKIENGRKKFPFENLEKLAELLNKDFEELKRLFVAEILIEEVNKYSCDESVYALAENQSNYLKNKNATQGKLQL